MKKRWLYLGSSSQSRHMLLQEARIPFKAFAHGADERQVDHTVPFQQLVPSIARYKMDHLVLPAKNKGSELFVLTADTMSIDLEGLVQGKAYNYADALKKLKHCKKNHI